ncbi:hypothetical protein BCR42DRAFT_393313 [Absidia repens]|uniref:Dipeptidase n=1 Tax=Absidia repens TaxID=90262 RepID=A0A1X2IDD4_9FUNG|nr:hypothetical protein BCR42DRAFT_393313 [Absidia repens]
MTLQSFIKEGKLNHFELHHVNNSHTDISRILKGHLTGQFWSLYSKCEWTDNNQVLNALESIGSIKRMIRRYPTTLQLAYRSQHVASMIGIEGGQMIGNSMAALRTFYDLGVRYMAVLSRLAPSSEVDGMVMVNFYDMFVACGTDATLFDVADHIDHIGKVTGRDKVGIGSDYNGIQITPTDSLLVDSLYNLSNRTVVVVYLVYIVV